MYACCGNWLSEYAEDVTQCAKACKTYAEKGCCGWSSKESRYAVTTQPQSHDRQEQLQDEKASLLQDIVPLQSESDDLRTRTRLLQEINRLQSENDDLKIRLSQIVSAKMTDNNPDVVNLGDTNRPDKLRDKYLELYDNEWTDAYSDLVEDGLSTEHAIDDLLNILMTSYRVSQVKASSQLESLSCFGGMDKLPVEVAKGLKENRKLDFNYMNQVPKVETEVIQHLDFKGDIKKPLGKYLQECVSLTWLMAIQDPPMVLDDPSQVKGKPFNKKIYREYMTAGSQVKFVVWPAMFMNAGGSLAKKGVAECHDS